jgi:hypothetical protein
MIAEEGCKKESHLEVIRTRVRDVRVTAKTPKQHSPPSIVRILRFGERYEG